MVVEGKRHGRRLGTEKYKENFLLLEVAFHALITPLGQLQYDKLQDTKCPTYRPTG
jgi:hypothetical protein